MAIYSEKINNVRYFTALSTDSKPTAGYKFAPQDGDELYEVDTYRNWVYQRGNWQRTDYATTRHRNTVVLAGESLTARNSLVMQTSLATDVVGDGTTTTITLASSAVMEGSKLNFITGQVGAALDNKILPVTNINVNSFTVPSPLVGSPTAVALWNNQMRHSERGWFTWANMYLKQRLFLLNNAAIGSSTIQTMLDNMATQILAYNPFYCMALLGINDLGGGASAASVLALAQTFYSRLIDAGIMPIALTCFPLHQSFGTFAATTPRIMQFNYLLQNYCAQQGIHCIDTFAALVDPAQTDGRALANAIQGTAGDFIHPSTLGARLAGKAVSAYMANLVPPIDLLTKCQADNYGANSGNKNLCDQAPWASSGGTVTAPMTGTVPTGFTFQRNAGGGAGAAAVNARTLIAGGDTFGNNVDLTLTSSAANDAYQLQCSGDLASRFQAGKSYRVRTTLKLANTSGSGLSRIQAELLLTYGTTKRGYIAALDSSESPPAMPYEDGTFVVETPTFTIPAGATPNSGFFLFFIFTFLSAGTAVTVSVGRQTVVELP